MTSLIPSDPHAQAADEQPRHDRSKPKLMFFGDPHGDLEPVIAAVQRLRPEAIVLLGDIQARRPLHIELRLILDLTEVWYIHGNHDTDADGDYDSLWESELAERNLHGRVVEIAGYKIAGLGGIFRTKIWDPRQPIEEAAFSSAEALRLSMRPAERWRGGIARRHRSSIFPEDFQQLLRSGPADILASHEAPSAHPHGWRAIDELAETLGVQLVIHGHHHQTIDYLEEGLQSAAAPFRAFGVDMGSHLSWPRDPREWESQGPAQELLDRATQVFGPAAQAWLDTPHPLLDAQTPAAVAAGGGAQKVRAMLSAIQHGGVA